MKQIVFQLINLFNKQEKIKLVILFFLMLFGSLLEGLGIGVIAPFLIAVLDSSFLQDNHYGQLTQNIFNFKNHQEFVFFACILLVAIFLAKNLYITFMLYCQYRFSFNQQSRLSIRLLQVYLSKPYEFFLKQNAAELQRNVTGLVSQVVQQLLLPFLLLFSELMIAVVIIIVLIMQSPIMAFTVGSLLGIFGVIFSRLLRDRLASLGHQLNKSVARMMQWVNQSIHGIREVKVLGREGEFLRHFSHDAQKAAISWRTYSLVSQMPRLGIEIIAVLAMNIIVVVQFLFVKDTASLIPIMAVFAMAAFRLMPSINRIISYYNTIQFGKNSLDIVCEDLRTDNVINNNIISQSLNQEESIYNLKSNNFQNNIVFDNVSYAYPDSNTNALTDINLTIPRGISIGLVGISGAGKTTLANLFLGLLKPTQGEILVNGVNIQNNMRGWQNLIGYIPQHIYLMDDTISKNVTFGLENEQINEQKVWQALRVAQLEEFVRSLPNQLDTVVGDQGIRLSGGQRQRIGIARALYHDPPVLVLDEATSALDSETEQAITESIEQLGKEKTMLIIAHRTSTIAKCDVIYKVESGRVKKGNIG